MKITRKLVLILAVLTVLTMIGIGGYAQVHAATTYQVGDVFVAISDGLVQWCDPSGAVQMTLDTGSPGTYTTGMAFDSADNLYVTNFDAGDVKKFDNAGNLIGVFGSGYSGSPESIVFNTAGHAYVGAVDGDNDIREFDAAGNPVAQFDVAIEDRGSDWIDLAADQRTMLYTSEGTAIHAYDVVADTQLPDFAGPGTLYGPAFALRILPDGSVLVADTIDIRQVAPGGTILNTWSVTGETDFFALNLDPDGEHFWSASFSSANVYKFRLDTPGTDTHVFSFNTGTGYSTVFGLAIFGEPTAGVLENFVKGGGKIGARKATWTFGGNVGLAPDGGIFGQFQINDHVNKVAYHSTEITALAFSGDPATTPDASHNTAVFTATFRGNDGSTKTVTVTIKDLGEKAPKMDTIKLEDDLVLSETALNGGNFQVHDVE